VTPSRRGGGDTRVKAIKSDSDSDSDEQKRSSGLSGKNRGVTPSVAAPGVTHPSDATDAAIEKCTTTQTAISHVSPQNFSQLNTIYVCIYLRYFNNLCRNGKEL